MRRKTNCAAVMLVLALAGCAATRGPQTVATIQYVGSSTIANFLRDAQDKYAYAKFIIDTAPESSGAEQLLVEGKTELAGIAMELRPETLAAGVTATLIGRDGIAVIVHHSNSISNLPIEQLKGIFTGKIRNWKEIGGSDIVIKPFITSRDSATHRIFRAAVLKEADYEECEVVRPDSDIVERVANDPGSIGQISFAFLDEAQSARAISVNGQAASVLNFSYPIVRPLYLCTKGKPTGAVKDFIEWSLGPEGQAILTRRFIGASVVGAVSAKSAPPTSGRLIVRTETYTVNDGGVYYYPHLPYDIYDINGRHIRHVCNHRSDNDENPATIELAPGRYLIRADTSGTKRIEFVATIEPGRATEIDVKNFEEKK